ncbi:MarR family winged helix-turn-helix transcriptional regulator [Allosalinactinospora lopnorensis]|uniref:MarR family winged helix-turn-helix transcriptional regulator n=1 Tax=Allosalinactinospora lopnorensis TaxID=1352348 RepID=UPI0006963F82|nr:MarR family transcriptional regulator [Allosalinactinospora lopnorensis]
MATPPAERLHELVMEFVRTSGLLQPDRVMPGESVSLSQAFAIHELDEDGPLSQRDLAERLSLDKSSVSRMAAELERKGVLVRERDPDNRRLYRLRLTDEGRAQHVRMSEAYHAHYVRWAAALAPEEVEALVTGLSALVRVVEAEGEPGPDTSPSRPRPQA